MRAFLPATARDVSARSARSHSVQPPLAATRLQRSAEEQAEELHPLPSEAPFALAGISIYPAVSPQPVPGGSPAVLQRASDPAAEEQQECVDERAGCPSRPGGIPDQAEVEGYNAECRAESGYEGPNVWPGCFEAPAQTPPEAPPEAPPQQQPPSPAPPKQTRQRAPVGKNGMFKADTPTPAFARWDYIVYENEVRLGNRKADDTPGGPVIGSLPWMANNPGDLTGNLHPVKEDASNPNSPYRQERRVWGERNLSGPSPDKLTEVGAPGLSAQNAAVKGVTVRTDLAIFADRQTGRNGLKDWIQKYYADVTLAESIQAHLGPEKTHVKGVDDPKAYPVRMQQYLTDKNARKYPSSYVRTTKGKDVAEDQWDDVIDAYGFAEGYSIRNMDPSTRGANPYVVNAGVIYTCNGREDPLQVADVYKNLARVTSLPKDTPPEIKALLGCP